MAKYVFLEWPTHGHVNPTLAVVQELVKRGQEVIYYLPEQFRETIQATGATFRSYETVWGSRLIKDALAGRNTTVSQGTNGSHTPQMSHDPKLEDVLAAMAGTVTGLFGGARLPALIAVESYYILPQLLDRIRADQPDCIVYGSICVWGRIVAQALDVPAIASRDMYLINEHISSMLMQRQNLNSSNEHQVMAKIKTNMLVEDLCKKYHVSTFDAANIFALDEPCTIVFIPKAFQPAADSLDEQRYVFVGPSILPRHETSDFPLSQLSTEQPILYISLGTVFNNWLAFFKMCFEAFGGQPWQVVLSRGRKVDAAALSPVPDNFLISPYVPQLEILSRAQVFVTHAGMNSTMESLYYGVPMVAVPQMAEQAITAQRIAELGLGIALEKEAVNATTLREAVERVANEVAFREHAQNMQHIICESGGYIRAADVIIRFSKEHTI